MKISAHEDLKGMSQLEYCTAHEGWDVTRGYSVPQTSPFVTSYQEGVQLVKAGDRGGVCSQK